MNDNDRHEFNHLQSAKARAAEQLLESDFWDRVAYTQRYGSSEELDQRGMELGSLVEWWASRGPYVSPEDKNAIEGLSRGLDRLREIWITAEVVEKALAADGYEFDPSTQLIKEIAKGRRGKKRALLSRTVTTVFDKLTDDGWPRSNTAEVRQEIRRILSDRFHPDLLGIEAGKPIHSAINSALNP